MTEKSVLQLGIMPLTDSAPFVVAQECGFFNRYGLEVQLCMQNSWSTLREKLYAGILDAAQLLAPMPLAENIKLNEGPRLITPMVLSRNGNAISISKDLQHEICRLNGKTELLQPLSARVLEKLLAEEGERCLRFAAVHPYSCHYYQLLSWFRSFDVSLERIEIIILPPSQMVTALQCGDIDGFCVSSPWNTKAVRSGNACTVLTATDVWPSFPEKVLGLLDCWYDSKPDTCYALMAALRDSCQWLSSSANRLEAARILSRQDYLDLSLDVVAPSLLGASLGNAQKQARQVPQYNQFLSIENRSDFSPLASYGDWLLVQMQRAGQIKSRNDFSDAVGKAYREDIYERAWEVYA